MRVTTKELLDAVSFINGTYQGGIRLVMREDDGLNGFQIQDLHGEDLSPRYRRKSTTMGWLHGFAAAQRRNQNG